jgi:hypothetical protein
MMVVVVDGSSKPGGVEVVYGAKQSAIRECSVKILGATCRGKMEKRSLGMGGERSG